MDVEIKITCPSAITTILKKTIQKTIPSLTLHHLTESQTNLKFTLKADNKTIDAVLNSLGNIVEEIQNPLETEITLLVRNCENSESPLNGKIIEPAPGIQIQPWQDDVLPTDQPDIIYLGTDDAFGVGTHPTTRLCLNLISDLVSKEETRFSHHHVLDIGCGSGILALAAGKFGAQHVVGLEIDSNSAQIARQNVDRNNMQTRITILHGTLEKTNEQFDLVLANLVIGILLPMINGISHRLKPDGMAILSGFNIGQVDNVTKMCSKNGLHALHEKRDNGWGALLLKKE